MKWQWTRWREATGGHWLDAVMAGLAACLTRPLPMPGRRERVAESPEPLTVRLRRDEVLRLGRACGRRGITVHHGIIWLTGTPASGDVLLEAGARFRFYSQWPIVLQALEEAEITLLT